MAEEQKNIDLRSEEVKDILGRVPKWITRYGSFFVLFALIMILLVGGIVRYPDLVSAPLEITASAPPIPLYSNVTGNLEEIYVENGDYVEKGQVLGILENALDEISLFEIEAKLDSLLLNPDKIHAINFPTNINLGRLQVSYSTFLKSIKDYQYFDNANFSSNSISFIQNQINQLYSINSGIQNQSGICQQELDILYSSFINNQNLLNKGLIAQRILDESQAIYYQKQAACENLKVQLTNNQLRIQELRTNIFNISSDNKQGGQDKNMLLSETSNRLLSEIDLWKRDFLIIAPVEGNVSLNQIWSPKQYVNINQELLTIIQNEDEIRIFSKISSKDIAKVKVGQEANINLEAYHYLEYGFVKGKVSSISQVPREGLYQVEITLNNGLISTYNKKLSFTQGMLGQVEIVSQQRTFLSRIFDTFKHLRTKKYD